MQYNIEILNPANYSEWDDMVLKCSNYSFFHSVAWSEVLTNSYHYKPLFFSIFDKNRIIGLVPIMEIKSILTGSRGVSLPFSDYCEPICSDKKLIKHIHKKLYKYGKDAKWKSVEIRSEIGINEKINPSIYFYNHVLDVRKSEKEIFQGLHRTTRGNIKRAKRDNIIVAIKNTLEALGIFYDLHSMTRKKHGLPVQPSYFFKNIYDLVISKKFGNIFIAYYNNLPVSAAIFFHIGEKAIYKYSASDLKFIRYRGNNLVMWEGIRWYAKHGFRQVCFGRTEKENRGLRMYKKGWGPKEKKIFYYKYDYRKGQFIKSRNNVNDYLCKILTKMPTNILKMAGKVLYKHYG
jgi:hypothetical protein